MQPKNIFQILIVDRLDQKVEKHKALETNISSLKATYPDAIYQMYGNEELLDFISENFSSDVLHAYRLLVPNAFKADLARYCLLYKFGGLYCDLSYLCLRPIDVDEDTEMVVFRDVPGHPSWATSNALIYAKAGCEVLERAVNRVVHHYKTQYIGVSPLEPTGPYMFGRVLAETENWKSIKFGDSKFLNIDSTGRSNILKIMPTGEVVAIRNKTHSGVISDLIVSGGNNYVKLWNKGHVWGMKKPDTLLRKLKLRLSK